jgi:peroxiredoxin
MQNKQQSTFPILSDLNEEVMKSYDVLFSVTKGYQHKVSLGKFTSISNHNGQDEAHLPVPATFIIDRNQKIVFRHFDYDYSERASVEEILEALKNVK